MENISSWNKLIKSFAKNVKNVFNRIIELLPESPPFYPKDQLTDKPERFFVNEKIREKILLHYKKEIPYAVEVDTEEFFEEEKIILEEEDNLVKVTLSEITCEYNYSNPTGNFNLSLPHVDLRQSNYQTMSTRILTKT